jgi:ankyrin repeat protein
MRKGPNQTFILWIENNGNTLLHDAIYSAELVQYLVELAGVDIHAANTEGNTPLHIGSESGYLKVVQCLVEMAGADVHAANANGRTAQHLASAPGQLEKWSHLI